MHWLDPNYLPEIVGVADRFLLDPHGQADGIILTNGTEVHFPPHLSDEIHAALRPGDTVKVRGVRPRSADMIAAVAIETTDGRRIVDNGPPDHHEKKKEVRKQAPKPERQPMYAEGFVQRALHGPKGEVRGALFRDGRIVRLPAHEARSMSELLSPGAHLAVRGEGLVTEFGTVIDVREIGTSKDTVRLIKPEGLRHDKSHRGERKRSKHEREHRKDMENEQDAHANRPVSSGS
jgi:hypothetical protein